METENRPTRVLLVDDFEPWRTHVRSFLSEQPWFKVVAEASDGRVAVQLAEEVQPGLILLDLGLPRLSGIDAARLIRQVARAAKILFVSENRDSDIIRAALSAGGHGYVVKSDAASELLVALRTVVRGEQFVSRSVLDIDHFLTPSLRAPV